MYRPHLGRKSPTMDRFKQTYCDTIQPYQCSDQHRPYCGAYSATATAT